MPLIRDDWVRILNPETKITHHAYPIEDQQNLYTTICNIIVTTDAESSYPTHETGWVIIDRAEELTCEDCIRWISMGPIDDL